MPQDFIRICPFTKTVELVTLQTGQKINELIVPPEGYEGAMGSGLICFAYARGNVQLMVDDEGLYMDWPYFTFDLYPQALAGRAILCSVDDEGETIPATDWTVESVRQAIDFAGVQHVEPRFEIITDPKVLEAYFGF